MVKEPLSSARILMAALALADEGGIERLSMRRLGSALGVEAMSLYHYFATKEHLLDALVDTVYAQIDPPSLEGPWTVALARRSASMRQALLRHPWAVGLIGTRRQPGPATLSHLNAVLGCLRHAGFSWAGAAHAIALLDAYVLGFAVQEGSLPLQSPEQTAEVAAALVSPELERLFPHLAGFITNHALAPGYSFAAEFEAGLALVLDGLAPLAPNGGA